MALGIEQLDDFVASYLQKYPMGKWQDISSPLQEYMFASRLFDRANKKEMSTSQCKWKLKVDNNDNFQVVGLYHRDSSSRVNVLTEGSMKWGMTTTNYHYDIDEETFAQGADAIVDYLNLQEQGLMQDFFAGIEDLMFGAGPSSPTQSPFPPVSLLHWITATDDSTTENNSEEGFDGYEPLGIRFGWCRWHFLLDVCPVAEPDVPVHDCGPGRLRGEGHQFDGPLHIQASGDSLGHQARGEPSVGTADHAQSRGSRPEAVAVGQRQHQGRLGCPQRFGLHPRCSDDVGSGLDEFQQRECPYGRDHSRCGLEYVRLVLRSGPQHAEADAVPASRDEQRPGAEDGRCRSDCVLQSTGEFPWLLLGYRDGNDVIPLWNPV